MLEPHGHSDELQARNFRSAFSCTRDPAYVFPGEAHDFWELFFLIDGEATVAADARVYRLRRADIIFHRPMEFHKYNIESGRSARIFVLSFELSGRLAEQFSGKVATLNPAQYGRLLTLCDFLNEKSPAGSISCVGVFDMPLYGQAAKNMFELFLLSLLDESDEKKSITDLPGSEIYRRAVEYMKSHITENLSVKEIARACGVSATVLKTVFAAYAGIGVHKYFLTARLQYAIPRLRAGGSVSEIADALNFSSQSYFSTVFKRETGRSPSAYRRP